MAEKEYIERGAVVDYLNKVSEETDNWYEEDAQERPENLICYFKSIPAADVVEVRHGEWEEEDENSSFAGKVLSCSQCGAFLVPHKKLYHRYCYNCGAKMDGGTNAK